MNTATANALDVARGFEDMARVGLPFEPDPVAVQRALMCRSLPEFVKHFWDVIERKTKLVWNWHLDVICTHLQLVTAGVLNYLVINIPPRHTKSLIVSVFWPAWEWARGLAHHKFVCGSYAEKLSIRDSVKMRRLILSPEFKSYFPDFALTSDVRAKERYENAAGGYRIATSVDGVGTGEGGDRVIADDPHNVLKVHSDVIRTKDLDWWRDSMSSRINDENTGAYVVIMQRSHQEDLTGWILDQIELGDIPLDKFAYICFPARFDGEHRTISPLRRTGNAPLDPRKYIGEPLDKGRYPEPKLKVLEGRMTEYSRAAQLQQRPVPKGGLMFQIDQFKILTNAPSKLIFPGIRYWDKAGTEGGGMWTSGVLMFKMVGGGVWIEDVVTGQWAATNRERNIKGTAESDGKQNVTVWVEQEPGSGGKESAEGTISNLAGWRVYADRVTGEKSVRAEPYAVQQVAGNVYLKRAPWNKRFISNHEFYPYGKLKDDPDAAGGAFNKLHAKTKGRIGTIIRTKG